ncbi:MAG TPA: beta-propeller domain-containing protein [Candidatus Sulfotelmatobacter sp.]|nr:beta-propeller domain-containing protein [Candidatus Sulfotelmatobacter sp.]
MVQQEVKKKTRVYATVAILAAMVLVSLIYVFGGPGFISSQPATNPDGTPNTNPGNNPNTNPNTNPSTTPNTNPGTNPDVSSIVTPEVSGMKTFTSYEELKNYLTANSNNAIGTFGGGPLDQKYLTDSRAPTANPASPSLAAEGATSANSYSTTNIQVAGVDEADTTKNDGTYIYTQSSNYTTGQNYVYIVKADPTDPRVVARIRLDNNTYLAGMFLSQDSNKLVLMGSQYQVYALGAGDAIAPSLGIAIAPNYYSNVQTFVNVYDISDKVHPTLVRNYTLSGSYFNSRMIGDYVYAVISQSAYIYNDVVPLPKVYATTGAAEIAATQIYYSDTADFNESPYNYFTFTSFYGLNLKDPTQLTNMTVLMGGASTMYVSLGNMYITYPTWSNNGQYTAIYRVSIDNGKLAFQAKGSVPGSVINQYSMDEFNNYFRLATTNWKNTTENSVYVLNMNLNIVGALDLKNTELRETIQSTRFIGNKAYIVTFEQKDPFFVLDMSNPAAPRIAGKLEIPGFSSYLHPYDENHVIGIGMENRTAKLSLFDVTDVNAPREIAKYIVQGDYSYSQAQYDPKAFLFDLSKQLLVIPVQVTNYGVISPTAPDSGTKTIVPTQAGYWQGAYVFKLTVAGGFELRGIIAHQDYTSTTVYYGYDYGFTVNRALYIGNTLYTVSNSKIKLNSLTDLSQIAEVKLT